MLFTIVFLISEVFQIYEAYLLMRCFFKECRVSGRVEVLVYAGLFVMMSVPYLVFGIPVVNFICSYSGMILVTFIYVGSFKKRFLSGTLLYIIVLMAECVIAVFSGYGGVNVFHSSKYYSIFGTICVPLAQFLIILIVRNFKNISEGESVPVAYWIICVALPILSVVLFYLFSRQKGLQAVDLFIATCIIFVINMFVFYLYDHQIEAFRIKKEKETLVMQNQYQRSQLELMNQAVEQSREQRHDFLRHISMVSYMIEQKKEQQVSEYLEEIQGNMAKKQQYVDTGNFVLDGLLNYKIQEATVAGIQIEADVKIPEELELSVYDMNIILTNLLDNSMEAVKSVEDKRIGIYIVYNKNRLQIKIDNVFEGERIREKGHYRTTKVDGKPHGYGLKNVAKAVKKYDGIFEIREAGDHFTVEIVLFMG